VLPMILIADLFCGAGGAAMGIHRAMEAAGQPHRIVGFDLVPQPRYPFEFVQQDALTVDLSRFDAVWASPPCQAYSMAGVQWRKEGREYPDLVAATRERLEASGLPWAIENVPGAPLRNPTVLNGAALGIRRTRWFETSFPMPLVLLPPEGASRFRMGRKPGAGDCITPVGHFTGVAEAQRRMGIDWMRRGELTQAVPPAYSEYIWRQLILAISQRR